MGNEVSKNAHKQHRDSIVIQLLLTLKNKRTVYINDQLKKEINEVMGEQLHLIGVAPK